MAVVVVESNEPGVYESAITKVKCLAADTLPETYAAGSEAYEMDSGKRYHWTGEKWYDETGTERGAEAAAGD